MVLFLNGIQHRIDGPAYIWYYESGQIEKEDWYINSKELKNNELIEYAEWLTNYNLYNKSYDTWSNQEKILWRLTWI